MNGNTQEGSTTWHQVQYQYHHHQETSPTPMVPSRTMSDNTMLMNHYNNSACRGDDSSTHELSPKGNLVKPVRTRRFRASRKTPVTLLSANISNFRSLVQQYTGCQTANPFSTARKGPINLSFAEASEENDFHNTNSSTFPMFGSSYHHDHQVQAHQRLHYQEPQQQSSADFQQKFAFGINQADSVFQPTISDVSPADHSTLTIDDFAVENTCLTW